MVPLPESFFKKILLKLTTYFKKYLATGKFIKPQIKK